MQCCYRTRSRFILQYDGSLLHLTTVVADTGLSALCPASVSVADKTRCDEDSVCYQGVSVTSHSSVADMHACSNLHYTRSSAAVAVIADRTAYDDVRYSYRPLSGIAVVSVRTSDWSLLLLFSRSLCFVAKRYIGLHPTTNFSEEVNRKCPARSTTVPLSTPYNDPQRYRQTDRQTDDSIMPIADHTACSSTIS